MRLEDPYLLEFIGFESGSNVEEAEPLTEILPGAFIILDARVDASLTYDGSNLVSAWADQSGNGVNFTANSTDLPVRTVNHIGGSNTAVVVPDTTVLRSLVSSAFPSSTFSSGLLTVYTVGSLTSNGAFFKRFVSLHVPGQADGSNNGRCFIGKRNATDFNMSSRRNSVDLSRQTGGNNALHVFCNRWDNTNHQVFVDGTAFSPAASTGAFNFTHVMIFQTTASPSTNTQWQGALGHLLIYPDAHTDEEIDLMTTFLMDDWGL